MRQAVLDLAFGLVMLGLGAFLLYETTDPRYAAALAGHEFPPMFYPRLLLGLWLFLAFLILLRGGALLGAEAAAPSLDLVRLGGFIVLAGIYVTWLVFAVGFLFASVAFALLGMLFLGARHKLWVPVIGVGFPLLVWHLFQNVLGIPLPKSPWFLTI